MAQPNPNELDLLTRFICTGSEEGCFNVMEKPEFKDKTPSLSSFLTRESGALAIRRIKRIHERKGYVKKEPLLYSLARIIRNTPVTDTHEEDKIRQDAYALAESVCETAEDLFTFVEYDKMVSGSQKVGWGGGMRRLVHRWYETKTPQDLVSQVTRCKSARGWSHRDLVRQCHIPPDRRSPGTSLVINYLISGKKEIANHASSTEQDVKEILGFLRAVESLKTSRKEEAETIRSTIDNFKLCDKQIPTALSKVPQIYEGMLGHISLEELFRNIPKMAQLKMLETSSHQATRVLDRINSAEDIKEQKVPPMVILAAMEKYMENCKHRGARNNEIVKALRKAFDVSQTLLPKLPGTALLVAVHLQHVKGKKKLRVRGAPYLTPVTATAHLITFINQTEASVTHTFFNDKAELLDMNEKTSLVNILEKLEDKKLEEPTFNLAEPIKWAKQRKDKYDNILIITDFKKVETAQESQAFRDSIQQYRDEMNMPNCKVSVIGLCELVTSVGDKKDLNLLEISGLNELVPHLLLRFFCGDLDFDASGED